MREEINRIWKILHRHEQKLRKANWEKTFKDFFKRKLRTERQRDLFHGVHLALVVDTRDPLKQNRVRFFSPVMHLPQNLNLTEPIVEGATDEVTMTPLASLDWAWPISAMGGFDDCGLSWVPPPGSTVAIVFLHGNPHAAYYIGTTWQRDKGPESNPNWNYPIPEYQKIFKGHRKGYMVGKNDESQHKPPFDTDNYQGFDVDTTVDVDLVPDAQTKTTTPHRYGLKTPEKHMISLDDGDPKCNRRWKRLEIMSSMGHYFLMKDDPYHHCGEWVNPKCKISFVYVTPDICVPSFISYKGPDGKLSVIPTYYPCEQGEENCQYVSISSLTPIEWEYEGTEFMCPIPDPMSTISISTSEVPDCMGLLKDLTDHCFSFINDGKNKYHKHRQECYPFLQGCCGLPQSGMMMLSRSQHSFVMDDSVEQPRERPIWERTLQPFDMDGCTGVYRGRTYWRSATGHFIELNDTEVNPKIRGPANGITIGTACGNMINLNDHTKCCCVAGEMRGVHIRSTADHSFDMVDDTNQQCSPTRDGCGKPGAYSKKAFVRLRSGYGITILMNDAHNQQKTDQQYLQIKCPQKDNLQRGPHILHMQERPNGPGQILLRAGGDYVVYSYDDMVEVVGDQKDNPANKMEFVSNMKLVSVGDVYYNKAKTHCFWADDHIFLLAGKDCAAPYYSGDAKPDAGGTCVYPVVVATTGIPEYIQAMCSIKASEHVFASAIREPEDPCEGIASDVKGNEEHKLR